MVIGIASPIAVCLLKDFLDFPSQKIADKLSDSTAPAVTTLAIDLLILGHRLVIFTLDEKCRKIEILKGKNIIIYVGPEKSNGFFRRLDVFYWQTKVIKKLFKLNNLKFDILSVHWTRDYALVAKSFFSDCPICVTVRDIFPYIIKQHQGLRNYQWYVLYLKNELVMRSRKIHFISNSEYTARQVQKYWKINTPIIYNPIHDSYFNLPLQVLDDSAVFKIVTISTSAPNEYRKNVETLIYAFHKFYRQYPNSSLYLVGPSFNDSDSIIRKWKSLGLMDGCVLCGKKSHDEVVYLLNKSSLLVHPSREETFGNILLEAMSAGCVVLAGKNSGAVPYVLEHGKAGYLCDVDRVEDIVKWINYIYTHREEVDAKRLYAKQYCFSNFSSRKIAKDYVDYFTSLICQR